MDNYYFYNLFGNITEIIKAIFFFKTPPISIICSNKLIKLNYQRKSVSSKHGLVYGRFIFNILREAITLL